MTGKVVNVKCVLVGWVNICYFEVWKQASEFSRNVSPE